MKKLVIFCICAVLLTGAVWGEDARRKENERIYDMSRFFRGGSADTISSLFGKNVYFLDGFDFEHYQSTDPGLQKITETEVSAVRNGVSGTVTPVGRTDPYSLIGYSQGGLRALGFITQTEKSYQKSESNIDAVITISGINRGLKMLDGGLGILKRNASDKIVNVIGNGLRAAAGIFSTSYIYSLIFPRNMLATAIDIVIELLPSSWRPYYVEAWNSTDASKYPQLGDMIPESKYIKDNVVVVGTKTYKVKTNETVETGTMLDRTTDGSYIYMPYTRVVEEYRYYTRTGTVTQFDPSVPIGFIVGTDNDTIGMHEEKKETINKALRGAGIAFGVVQGIHIVKCIGIIGLLSGSVTMARDADKAKKLMLDFDSTLNDMKGSTDNDGLVAVESQYIPQAHMDNPVLQGGEKGYSELKLNHKKIGELPDAYRIAQSMIIDGKQKRKEQRDRLGEPTETRRNQ